MAKKSPISLYLIGMVLVVIGCFLPLTASGWGFSGSNAVDAIKDGSGDLKIAAILALAGAVAGIVFSFVHIKGLPLKLASLAVSAAGGVYMVLSFLNLNPVAKNVGKLLGKASQLHPSYGLILIVAGWAVAIVGYLQSRE